MRADLLHAVEGGFFAEQLREGVDFIEALAQIRRGGAAARRAGVPGEHFDLAERARFRERLRARAIGQSP